MGHIKAIFDEIKAKIESGEVKDNVIEFLKKMKAVIDAKITAAEPVVTAALEKVKAAIDELINKAIAEGEAAITQGKGLLVNILEAIMAKLGELKDNLATEYLSISDIIEAAQDLKDIFNQVKAKIESGEIKDSIVDFLQKLKDVVDAKIAAATPAVKAILEKVDEAIQAMIEKAQAHIETGKAILVDLLDTIIAKIAELKDSIAGYSILDDLLNDVLKPALKNAIENLIPTISKHLGDLADKLVGKTEYISITDIMQAAQALKDIFDMVKAKIESGEIQDHMVEFLQKLSAFIEAKIVAARPVVAAILQKVDEAVKILMEKAKNGIESGKAIMDELVRTILDKIAELKDSIGGYKVEYISIIDLIDAAQVLKDIFARVKAKIESGEIKDNIVDFLQKIKAIVDAKIAAATPAVKAILEKVDEAIHILIEKAKGHVETGRAILVDLLETIIAKISELKDNIAGYSIFEDLLTDVLKPALKHAIEGLVPVISKHLGDLADKLVGKTEYLSITDIFQAVQALKDVFDQIKAKIESGEIHDNLNDFLEKIKDVVEAKMTTANE